MKIRELYIENYKMFQDFKIDFVDSDDKPLDIVVLAGVNGSGKTTLLEWIKHDNKVTIQPFSKSNDYIQFGNGYMLDHKTRKKMYEVDMYMEREKTKGGIVTVALDENDMFIDSLDNKIIYLPIYENNIKDIKESILEHYRRLVRKFSHQKAIMEIQGFLNEIFTDKIDITFSIDDINIVYRDNEQVIFKNKSENQFDINELSTGEKTLLSKLLYLYFKDYKDKVILIDEPELSLHPSWQNRVLKIYENFAKLNNCQIIIATHSPNILINTDSESLRFLVKEEGKIITKKLSGSPLDRDLNTFLKTLMGTDYMSKELEELHQEYRKLFDERKEDTKEAKELEKKILEWESPNSSFWQGLAFDRELRDL
ncbi:MAG: hypothetical protein KU38_11150 [Sulfurovum sp. FS08-3]|nr:MAG: hypothetical protein KU38_11150 [Sulfurovum sp. FS08-3]